MAHYHEDEARVRVDRELLAGHFAWRVIAALSDPGNPDPLWSEPPSDAINARIRNQTAGVVIREAMAAGVTLFELARAELEIRRVYLPEAARRYLAQTARERFLAAQHPEPDGPGPDAQDYRVGSLDGCPDDDLEWPA